MGGGYSTLFVCFRQLNDIRKLPETMLSQSLAHVPVKYVSVQFRGGTITVLYGKRNLINKFYLYNVFALASKPAARGVVLSQYSTVQGANLS